MMTALAFIAGILLASFVAWCMHDPDGAKQLAADVKTFVGTIVAKVRGKA